MQSRTVKVMICCLVSVKYFVLTIVKCCRKETPTLSYDLLSDLMPALFVFLLLTGSVASGVVYGTIPHGSRVAPRSHSAGGEGCGCALYKED